MPHCSVAVDLAYFTREDTIYLNVMVAGVFHKIPISETHALSLLRQLSREIEAQWTSTPRLLSSPSSNEQRLASASTAPPWSEAT